jgi:hypothetical protein
MSARNIEDVYPLSPLQEGLLFHSLYRPEEGAYVMQLSCKTRNVDVVAIQRAWQTIIDRHPVFRTAFIWKNVEKPLQVVQRHVTLPFQLEDWRGLSASEQQERLDTYLAADSRRGFQLNKAPLLRLALFQLDDNFHHLVLSQHHIIVDGWSQALIVEEAFRLYEAYCEGRELQLEPTRPYREYIAWLMQQNLLEAEEFWRRTLKDFTVPTSILAAPGGDRESGYTEQEFELSVETTSALLSLGRLNSVTINTIVMGAWALLLSRYSGQRDVVFGVVMSGRPPDLAGVERMVGLFVNTLPMRIRVRAGDLLSSWLQEIQAQQLEMQKYEYSPLANVQQWSDLPHGEALIESLFTFENFPVPDLEIKNVEISIDESIEKTNYPLTLLVGAVTQVMVRVLYDDLRIDHATIKLLVRQFQSLLENMAAGFDRPLSAIEILAPVESELMLDDFNADLEEASI